MRNKIWIGIKLKIRMRIRIKVKRGIRIRIKVMRIHNPPFLSRQSYKAAKT